MEQARVSEKGLFCRFYVDPTWRLNGQHIPILYPFWGNPLTDKTPYYKELFDHQSFDTDYYAITEDIDQADAILLPYRLDAVLKENPKLLEKCKEISLRTQNPLLIDGPVDLEKKLSDIPKLWVLRYGGYRSSKRKNELTIPLYADDLLERFCGGNVSLRQKSTPPIVGFAGWTAIPRSTYLKALLKEIPNRLSALFDQKYTARSKGIFFRKKALDALRKSNRVAINVLERTSYSGHQKTISGDPKELRNQFVTNLIESDYGLDVRGDANNTIRLGEILSLGRIPVVIDTERNLPFFEELDYSKFALIIDFRDIPKIGEKIAAFHDSLTNEQFTEMQKSARNAYMTYFHIHTLTPRIIKKLLQK